MKNAYKTSYRILYGSGKNILIQSETAIVSNIFRLNRMISEKW